MPRVAPLIPLALAAIMSAGAARADLLGDAEAGKQVFDLCAGCHDIGTGAKDRTGPHLNGIFGRRAAAQQGFSYSGSMKRAGMDGLTWTVETLDVYIENPRALVSKTRMSFPGVKDPKDRANLMAYLRTHSDNPSNIPEAEPTARGTDHDLDPEILALQGDPDYGEYLATECLGCHQADGSAQGIPSITHWPQQDFAIAMHAYKKKLRPHPVMQMMAGRLSNEEIAALAAFFATLE